VNAKHKYISLSAFIKGVQHVNEPLSDGERLMLNALLGSVNYKTACSHPGNDDLMVLTNRSFRGVQELLKFLRAKRLIEIAEQGNGRGHATVHRFMIEDARYPEPRKPICVDKTDGNKAKGRKPRKPICVDDKTKHAEEGPEVRSGEAETTQKTGQKHADASATLPLTASLESHPHPPSSENGGGGNSKNKGAAKNQEPTAEDIDAVQSLFLDRLGKELPRDIAMDLFKVKKCRPMVIRIAVDRWLANREKGFVGLEHPETFIGRELFSKQDGEYLYYDRDAMTLDEQDAWLEQCRAERTLTDDLLEAKRKAKATLEQKDVDELKAMAANGEVKF
jgi:hypothetical protein